VKYEPQKVAEKIDGFYWEKINTANKAVCVDRVALELQKAYEQGFDDAKREAASLAQYCFGVSGWSEQAREVATVIRAMKIR